VGLGNGDSGDGTVTQCLQSGRWAAAAPGQTELLAVAIPSDWWHDAIMKLIVLEHRLPSVWLR
jgi:hypothetical protein